MKRQARQLLILSASLWVLSVMFPLVSPAWADINGNCGSTFKGVDIKGRGTSSAGDAIDVDNNEVVNVNMTSPAGFTSHKIDLEIAGVSRTVSNQTDAGDTQWSDTVNVKDYAWMGVGLPLTRALLIEGLVAGLIIGIALPSLGKLWTVMRVNAAMSKAEQQLRAAMPKAGPPPASTQEPPQP